MGFASEGAAVSICARSEGALRETEADLKTFGGKVHAAPCDLGDGPAVRGYVEDAAKALGGIDILINNASGRSEEHTSELQSLMRISYAVFCLKKKNKRITTTSLLHL